MACKQNDRMINDHQTNSIIAHSVQSILLNTESDNVITSIKWWEVIVFAPREKHDNIYIVVGE